MTTLLSLNSDILGYICNLDKLIFFNLSRVCKNIRYKLLRYRNNKYSKCLPRYAEIYSCIQDVINNLVQGKPPTHNIYYFELRSSSRFKGVRVKTYSTNVLVDKKGNYLPFSIRYIGYNFNRNRINKGRVRLSRYYEKKKFGAKKLKCIDINNSRRIETLLLSIKILELDLVTFLPDIHTLTLIIEKRKIFSTREECLELAKTIIAENIDSISTNEIEKGFLRRFIEK